MGVLDIDAEIEEKLLVLYKKMNQNADARKLIEKQNKPATMRSLLAQYAELWLQAQQLQDKL